MYRDQGMEAPRVTCVGEEGIDEIKDPLQKTLMTTECDLFSPSGDGQIVNGTTIEDNTAAFTNGVVCDPTSDTRSAPVGSLGTTSRSNPSASDSFGNSANDDLVTASDSPISRAAEAPHEAHGIPHNESRQDLPTELPNFSPQDMNETPAAFDKHDEEGVRSTEVCTYAGDRLISTKYYLPYSSGKQIIREAANPAARL